MRRRQRGHYYDDDLYTDGPWPTTISGGGPEDDDDEDESPRATLWLPNPDARRGWSMKHVYAKKELAPAPVVKRQAGFIRAEKQGDV